MGVALASNTKYILTIIFPSGGDVEVSTTGTYSITLSTDLKAGVVRKADHRMIRKSKKRWFLL